MRLATLLSKKWSALFLWGWLLGFSASSAGASGSALVLTEQEAEFVATHEVVWMCVDPDWAPFEWVDEHGVHVGIAAELIAFVARRTGLNIQVFPAATWEDSLAASRRGDCQVLSFLNSTPLREQWLNFSQPLFFDPNVIITHMDHPDITNLSNFVGATVALPGGTMVKERFALDFPDIHILPTVSEAESLDLVSRQLADMTVRSLMVAAHTIRHGGFFNLKVAGRLEGYDNELRMGVLKGHDILLGILDKGIASLTEDERSLIAGRYAAFTVVEKINYRLLWDVLLLASLVVLVLVYRGQLLKRVAAERLALANARVAMEYRARREQSRMVATLSHEIRTSLAVIDGAAQTLAHVVTQDDEMSARRLERIRRAVTRLTSLADRFLEKDRLDTEKLVLNRQKVNLSALVRDLIIEIDARDQVTFEGVDVCRIECDVVLMQLAVSNLLSNALNYAGELGPVKVTLTDLASHVRLCVQDSGPGVPTELQEELFQPYVRGVGVADSAGAGLGLYLVRRAVALHGGVVRLESASKGACFVLELPKGVKDTI